MRRFIRIIRNILQLGVAAVVLVAGAVTVNAVRHRSRQMEVLAVPRAPIDQQGAATRLREAVRFRTISNFLNPEQDAEELRGLQAHIAKSFPRFHATAKREIVAGYSLLYTSPGSDAKAPPIAPSAPPGGVPTAPGTGADS